MTTVGISSGESWSLVLKIRCVEHKREGRMIGSKPRGQSPQLFYDRNEVFVCRQERF